MAFIVPSQSFDTGKPLLGAITGFTEGLSQGIKARRQQDIEQQKAAAITAEQALREKAYAHGLQNEADIKAWAQKYGEFKAWDLAGAGAAPGQGPTSPGYQIPPESGVGPPMAVPQSVPQRGPMDQNAWIQKVQDLASTLPPDPKLREAFFASIEQDKQKQAINEHKDRILSQWNDAVLKGHFNTVGPDGTPNDAVTASAQAILQQMQNVDPEVNPQEAAQQLDHGEAALGQLSTQAAQHDFQMSMQRHTLETLDQQIAARKAANPSGNAIPDVTQAEFLRSQYAHGKLTDEELAKAWPDAINGTLQLKNEVAQHKMTIDSLKLENDRLKTELLESGRNARAQLRADTATDIQKRREELAKTLQGRKEIAERDENLKKYGFWARHDAYNAASQIPGFSRATHDEQQQMVDQAETMIHPNLVLPGAKNGAVAAPGLSPEAAQSATLQALKTRAKAEGWDDARILKELKAAGIDPNAPAPR